jgi:hypothetical protein
MKICPRCGQQMDVESRFCTQCGTLVTPSQLPSSGSRNSEEMNLPILGAMVALLLVALLIPPWEAPADQPPDFLGFRFILNPPSKEAVMSRLLLTIELVTIAAGGFYFSWLFRKKT